MKKLNLLILISAISILSYGQNPPANQNQNNQFQSKLKKLAYVSGEISIDKYHTEEELNKMNKLELTILYKERISYLVEVIPYLALHSQPGATLYDMAIPETPQNLAHLDKETKNKKAFLASVGVTLNDIIPYADKTNIIWCIMFYEGIIKKSAESFGTLLPAQSQPIAVPAQAKPTAPEQEKK